MRRRLSLAALVLVLVSWNAALFAAPGGNMPRVSAFTYLAGSLICHQQPARSFHRDAAQFPVCARCLGLYVGALAGALVWVVIAGVGSAALPRTRRVVQPGVARGLLIAAAIPTIASVVLAWTGVWDGSNIARALLAVPLGVVIAAVVTAVAAGDLR